MIDHEKLARWVAHHVVYTADNDGGYEVGMRGKNTMSRRLELVKAEGKLRRRVERGAKTRLRRRIELVARHRLIRKVIGRDAMGGIEWN